MKLSENLICLIYNCCFIVYFKILTISCQKIQIRERTLNIFDNFYAAPMNLQIFVWDSPQEKNHEKAKIWGSWKKWLFCFVYFVMKKSIIRLIFGIIWKIKI